MIYDDRRRLVLGRGDRAEIRLEDPFASSQPCARLTQQGNVVVIEDLGSTNGTYLNEEVLQAPQPLHPGDRVRIGDSEFTFEVGLTCCASPSSTPAPTPAASAAPTRTR